MSADNRNSSLPKIAVISAVVFAAVLALLLVLLPRGEGDVDKQEAEALPPVSVAERPDCPPVNLEGVALDCLGGEGTTNDAATENATDITVVNLWAWWCKPCREELPIIRELSEKHPEYTVVGVHADSSAANGAAMLSDLGMDMPSYQDSENLFAGTLGLPGVVPITVLFDRQGEMIGFLPRAYYDYTELEADIAAVLETRR